MEQTPAHGFHNPDLLGAIPPHCVRVIEIGCSTGALARELKKIRPACHYIGIDIDTAYVTAAKAYCDETAAIDIEECDEQFFESHADRDCWIFGDVLEHMRDPWSVLRKIRRVIPENGCIVACIPNAQHWSLQARLSIGDLRYEDSGLLDRTHLRWFTAHTIHQMFADSGFRVAADRARVFNEPARDHFLPIIGEMAKACGGDPATAMQLAMPLQYVVTAVPA